MLHDRRTLRAAALILVLAAMSWACAPRIERHPLPELKANPTEHVFGLGRDAIHDGVIGVFTAEHQLAEPLFGPIARDRPPEGEVFINPLLSVETSNAAFFGKQVFEDPANVNDLYLYGLHQPLWRSPVYRDSKGGLPFIATFHLHLVAEGPNRTKVSVTALTPRVINGRRLGFGEDGFGRQWREVRVKRTTIEE